MRFAFLGLPLYVPYGDEPAAPPEAAGAASLSAADAVRRASAGYAAILEHYDFDLGGPLVPRGVDAGFVDCGDVRLSGDLQKDIAAGTAAVAEIAAAGATPLVVAGDHSAPPVIVRGLSGDRPLDVLHVDAHLDFRDEVAGLRDGYSSPIRRLRELPWVRTVVQVGLRDVGSARDEDVAAARAAGNVLVRAEEVHERGVDDLVEYFEPGAPRLHHRRRRRPRPGLRAGDAVAGAGRPAVLAAGPAACAAWRAVASSPAWTSASSSLRATPRVTPRSRRRGCS